MRKKSIIFSCVLVYALAIGCKKEESDEQFCASCLIKTEMTTSGTELPPVINETTVEECGLLQETYDQYLKGGNATSTTTVEGVSMTMKMVTTCTKK